MSTFFGLTPQYKVTLHEDIFYMVKMGGGGWTWKDLYTMPTYLRTFYMNKLSDFITREQQQQSAATKKSPKKVLRPDISRKKSA